MGGWGYCLLLFILGPTLDLRRLRLRYRGKAKVGAPHRIPVAAQPGRWVPSASGTGAKPRWRAYSYRASRGETREPARNTLRRRRNHRRPPGFQRTKAVADSRGPRSLREPSATPFHFFSSTLAEKLLRAKSRRSGSLKAQKVPIARHFLGIRRSRRFWTRVPRGNDETRGRVVARDER